jgi:hypothetical protein
MIRPLLAFSLVLLLLSCASTTKRPLRFVDCIEAEYCHQVDDWPAPAWSRKHETLYWRGVRSILQEMACGRMAARGRRLAYVAGADLSVSCASGHSRIHHVKDRDGGNRLLATGQIDYVVEFERANAAMVRGGIGVPLSASFYGRVRRTGTGSRLEGMANYLAVQTDTMAEVRLVSRATP